MADYLKLHRKMLQWGWYSDTNTKAVFIHCLLKANWKPGEWKGIHYESGQFITSLQTLAVETSLTVSQVRTAIRHLKMTGEIADLSQGNYRVITVNNWNEYQGNDKPGDSPVTDASQTFDKPLTTDKEVKNKDTNNIYINNNRAFQKPSVEEVKNYCLERNNSVDPEAFVSFYDSKGWMIGKNKMKDWKAAVRTWEKSRKNAGPKPKKSQFDNFSQRTYDYNELMNIVKGE